MKSALISLLLLALVPVKVEAAEVAIGSVVRAEGPCAATGEGVTHPLAAGDAVHRAETVTTGADGRLELGFDDGTRLTVGAMSKVVLDDFVYAPAGESRLHASITGAFRYVSGRLGPGATRQAAIATSFALIGVRGTDFWGGPIDGVGGVIVFEGAVSVTTAAGTVILAAPGLGTDVAGPGASPGPVTTWPADKVARALATVTFP